MTQINKEMDEIGNLVRIPLDKNINNRVEDNFAIKILIMLYNPVAMEIRDVRLLVFDELKKEIQYETH